MGLGAILTLNEAAALLPIADDEARAWLKAQGLIRYLAGRPCVLWMDVAEALRAPEPRPESRPRAAGALPRVRL